MKFQFNSSMVDIVSNDVEKLEGFENVVKDLKLVSLRKIKNKIRKKISYKKGTDRMRKYALRYYLVNQDNKILNITQPFIKHKDAIKALRENISYENKVIYILPMKIVVLGSKYTMRGELNEPSPAFMIVAEI